MKIAFSTLTIILLVLLVVSSVAWAITAEDVEEAVNAAGREKTTGSVFIWFIVAFAFLKVSQKIDSFMSSLGINVGHTGGSLMADAFVAAKGVAMASGSLRGSFAGFGRSGGGGSSGGGSGGVAGKTSPFQFGLAGIASRSVKKGAMESATNPESKGIASSLGRKAFESSLDNKGKYANDITGSIAKGTNGASGTMKGPLADKAFGSYMGIGSGGGSTVPGVKSGNSASITGAASTQVGSNTNVKNQLSSSQQAADNSSIGLNQDGVSPMVDNSVVETAFPDNSITNSMMDHVAVSQTESATPNVEAGAATAGTAVQTREVGASTASQSLSGARSATAFAQPMGQPTYSGIEMGGGRITGIEKTANNPGGIKFAMYSADKYAEPGGKFETVKAADGSSWYKQYAQNTVVSTPYKDETGQIKQSQELELKLPAVPPRKDRL